MMVISSVIATYVIELLSGGVGGKFLPMVFIGGLLLWKGGPIFRYFSGKG
jgi:hypothetical protein